MEQEAGYKEQGCYLPKSGYSHDIFFFACNCLKESGLKANLAALAQERGTANLSSSPHSITQAQESRWPHDSGLQTPRDSPQGPAQAGLHFIAGLVSSELVFVLVLFFWPEKVTECPIRENQI